MKFESRKDPLYQLLTFGLGGLFIGSVVFRTMFYGSYNYTFLGVDIFVLVVIALLCWLYFGTSYVLTPSVMKYRCGPLRGEIEIARIREITKGKSLWSGLKPATARNGLIIQYDQYKKVYISPETNDTFIEAVLKIKQDIKITVA